METCKICPKSVAVYITQMVVILGVVIAAIINLSYNTENREVWISLLASNLGYVLPNPKLNRPVEMKNLNATIDVDRSPSDM